MQREVRIEAHNGLARELGESVLLLALTGSSVAALLAVIVMLTRALGR